jgi:hypothetical protein
MKESKNQVFPVLLYSIARLAGSREQAGMRRKQRYFYLNSQIKYSK